MMPGVVVVEDNEESLASFDAVPLHWRYWEHIAASSRSLRQKEHSSIEVETVVFDTAVVDENDVEEVFVGEMVVIHDKVYSFEAGKAPGDCERTSRVAP